MNHKDLLVGAHTSISGGLDNGLIAGRRIGGTTVQIFTKNASRWKAPEISKEMVSGFLKAKAETGLDPIVAHDSYLINLASPDPILTKKSINAFLTELNRAEALGIDYLVTHPGAHKGQGEPEGIRRFVENVNRIHDQTEGLSVRISLETTAGQGTNLGHRFEHLAEMIRGIEQSERVGVCFDTCHVFAAGYDLRDENAYHKTIEEFDRVVGIDRIEVIHANDSKRELGSRVDRHEHIGEGQIGSNGFRILMNDPRFHRIPKILETPESETQHEVNLVRLKSFVNLEE
jgi:deoxyribonuclease-4